jgi:cytoskeletal protein CcmA (bactofilin family)
MFRQSKRTEETSVAEISAPEGVRDEQDTTLPLVRRNPAIPQPADANGANGATARVDPLRRPTDPMAPGSITRRAVAAPPVLPAKSSEAKRLTVGRDICVRGEITACDVLVVEGRVEASIAGSNLMEIAETGLFKGDAEIDEAEIAGRFEGNLVVRDRLFIAATGRVTGSVRYRRLEIALGGEMVGDAQVIGGTRGED